MANIIYTYNGQKVSPPTVWERLTLRGGGGRKDSGFPASPYGTITPVPLVATWSQQSPSAIIRNQFKLNSAIAACVAVWASSFREATLRMYDRKNKEVIPDHPVTQLLETPNDIMGQDELWDYEVVYKLMGGNTYIHKV